MESTIKLRLVPFFFCLKRQRSIGKMQCVCQSCYHRSPTNSDSSHFSRQLSYKNLNVTEQDILSLSSAPNSVAETSDFCNELGKDYRRTSHHDIQADLVFGDRDSINSVNTVCSFASEKCVQEADGLKRSARKSSFFSRPARRQRPCSDRVPTEQNTACQLSLALELLPWIVSVLWMMMTVTTWLADPRQLSDIKWCMW